MYRARGARGAKRGNEQETLCLSPTVLSFTTSQLKDQYDRGKQADTKEHRRLSRDSKQMG